MNIQMKLIKLLSLVCLVGIAMISCSDGGDPEITISSPENNSTYNAGETVTVTGNAMDDEGLLSINIVSAQLGLNESFQDFDNPLNTNFEFNINLDSLTAAGDYDIIFTAFDLENNTDDETITITVQ